MRNRFLSMALLAAGAIAAIPAAFADTLTYVADVSIVNGGYRIAFGLGDLETNNFTEIGTDVPYQLGGIGYGAGHTLFGLDSSNSLVLINRTTGALTTIGYSGIPLLSFQPDGGAVVPFAATANGTLYGVDPYNNLYSFDQATGAGHLIGSTGVPYANLEDPAVGFANGLAAIGNTLFFSYHAYNIDPLTGKRTTDIVPPALWKLDLSRGVASQVGPISPTTAIFTGIGGVLRAVHLTPQYVIGSILNVNPQTGAESTFISSPPQNFFFAAVPAPEKIVIENASGTSAAVHPAANLRRVMH